MVAPSQERELKQELSDKYNKTPAVAPSQERELKPMDDDNFYIDAPSLLHRSVN